VREGLAMTQAYQVLLSDDNGQGLTEYALILALIALAAIGTVYVLGFAVQALYALEIPVQVVE